MTSILTPIVGAHFRPPAKALLQVLPSAHPLWLRPEPTNEYDENAVKVILLTDSLQSMTEDWWEEAQVHLAGQGYDKESILAEPEWQLGYMPKAARGTPFSIEQNIAHQLEVIGRADSSGEDVPASLTFDGAGKPMLSIAE